MGEKVYKPIKKSGHHLVKSKKNPSRYRGLSRDSSNKNQDIVEWEEIDLDEIREVKSEYNNYDDNYELSPEMEEAAEALGQALAMGIIFVSKEFIGPWFKNRVFPWAKTQGKRIKNKITKRNKNNIPELSSEVVDTSYNITPKDISTQVDDAFEQVYIDMTEEEVKEHFMRLFHHMFGVVNEIKIISNARLKNECKSEKELIEKRRVNEQFLVEKVSENIDRMLLDNHLNLDLETSKKLFILTGGGINLNNEYVPVDREKIKLLMEEQENKDE